MQIINKIHIFMPNLNLPASFVSIINRVRGRIQTYYRYHILIILNNIVLYLFFYIFFVIVIIYKCKSLIRLTFLKKEKERIIIMAIKLLLFIYLFSNVFIYMYMYIISTLIFLVLIVIFNNKNDIVLSSYCSYVCKYLSK